MRVNFLEMINIEIPKVEIYQNKGKRQSNRQNNIQKADLIQKSVFTISRHINHVFSESKLDKKSNLRFLQIANSDKPVAFYSLDVIISVGYRVKSQRGVQFRIWAMSIIKEYMKKRFVLDDDRLKELGGSGYFKKLLNRIRDIRAFEKVFYRQVLDIYSQV